MPRIPIEELKKDIEFRATVGGVPLSFRTTWGLFSPEKIDEGTALLAKEIQNIAAGNYKTALDLGCGYGALGIFLAKRAPESTVHLVDKDFVAVTYAKKNAELNGAGNTSAYLSNGFDEVPKDLRFDLIVSNLPAKVSKEFFWILFAEAHERLAVGGAFYVVTIAGLERLVQNNFKLIFENYELLAHTKTYFVAKAVKSI